MLLPSYRLLRPALFAALVVSLTSFAQAKSPSSEGPATACTALEFSPDATRLAVGEQSGAIRILELPTSRPLSSLPPGTGPVQMLRWSPDGKWLVFRSRETGLAVVEPHGVSLIPRVLAAAAAGDFRVAAFNTSGTLFAASGSATPLRVWHLPDWTEVPTGWPDMGITSLAFSPSGDELAICMERIYEVRVLKTTDWTQLASLKTSGLIFYSADGALQLLRDMRHQWYVETLRPPASPDHQPFDSDQRLSKKRVQGIGQIYRALAISGDGSAYAVAVNNYMRAHRFNDPSEPAPIALPASVTSVAISPDGSHYAVGCVDGTLQTGKLPTK